MKRRTFVKGGVASLLGHAAAPALFALRANLEEQMHPDMEPISIGLDGDWRFATAGVDEGLTERWFASDFDDNSWKLLRSGTSWEKQGIQHYGFGWYRKTLRVPDSVKGMPCLLNLGTIPSDDDVWVNGVRVGGWTGEYKYDNWLTRVYAVPAEVLKPGQDNTIALRVWGGDITFIGANSGLAKGPMSAAFDPFSPHLRIPGGQAVPVELFDLSNAQRGQICELILRIPESAAGSGHSVHCELSDVLGHAFHSATIPLVTRPAAEALVALPATAVKALYLRGRFRLDVIVTDQAGKQVYRDHRQFDHLSFTSRDTQSLPPMPSATEATPYGELQLIDEIDCSVDIGHDPHPYLESGFEKEQVRNSPGSPLPVHVSEILGKKARECDHGWFAYRIGRGRLKPHSTYLVRIEYPEDKPRYAPIELQIGHNYIDVGWRNGIAGDDVYDNWPLSRAWEWYDVVVALDDETVGTGGTGTASAEHGFWIYFMNKRVPDGVFSPWSAGPAVGRIKLYEIDAEKHSPVIRKPEGLPHRVLAFDWERQADHDPADIVRYARLMGYNAVSPIILKWAFANYSDPLDGYDSIVVDDRKYWAKKLYVRGTSASSPVPGKKSQHTRYLEATRRYAINYIPRFEWGGSMDLPQEAWAVDLDGHPVKPSRFAEWCCNLLHPLAWDDLSRWMEHMIQPHAASNPQMTGALWRVRSQRVPISYSRTDLEKFARETGRTLPAGDQKALVEWVAHTVKTEYEAWWHEKRAEFHKRLVALMKSYREDLTLYYYNWDADKFSLVLPDTTMWAFLGEVMKPLPEGGPASYARNQEERKKLTAQDYIHAMQAGDFGGAFVIKRADMALRPELYKDIHGIQLMGPVNALCYASKPEYINYFQTADGLAVSNAIPYDEVNSRTINPKFEGNMITPGGAPFSMAMELLAYFHGDARTLSYTAYTYGRGYAHAHRRFAQAFLALPATQGTRVAHPDPDVMVRFYAAAGKLYIGVAFKGYEPKTLEIQVPVEGQKRRLVNLVTGAETAVQVVKGHVHYAIPSDPIELHAYLLE